MLRRTSSNSANGRCARSCRTPGRLISDTTLCTAPGELRERVSTVDEWCRSPPGSRGHPCSFSNSSNEGLNIPTVRSFVQSVSPSVRPSATSIRFPCMIESRWRRRPTIVCARVLRRGPRPDRSDCSTGRKSFRRERTKCDRCSQPARPLTPTDDDDGSLGQRWAPRLRR